MILRFTQHLITAAAICFCILLATNRSDGAQTVKVSSTFVDTQLCVKGTFLVPLVVTEGFEDTNIFTIEMSNATGSFSNPTAIGLGFGNGISGLSVSCTLPANITPGTGYKIRAVAKYPAYTSTPNTDPIRVSAYPTMTITPSAPACLGTSVSISVSTTAPNPTISWQLPNGTVIPSGAVYTKVNSTFSDSGLYYITVSSYKCATRDSTRALVLPQPVFTGWDTDSTVCEGEKFDIKPLCNVCSLPMGQVSYSWSYPPSGSSFQSYISLFSSALNNQGWYKVKINVGTCSAVDSFFGKVKRLPNVPTVTNNGPVCLDDILKLDANSTTVTATYKWEGPNGFTSTLKNVSRPNIKKTDEGEYKVYAVNDGCISAPAKTTAIVGMPLAPLKVTGDTTLCPGDNLQLSAQTSFTTGIQWKKQPGGNIISTTRLLGKMGVTASDAGKYVVTQSDLGCTSPETYVNVVIPDVKKSNPVNNGPLCPGETLELAVTTPTDNGTYSWTGPGGFTSEEQNPVISSIPKEAKGVYKVTAKLGECTVTDSTTFVVKPVPVITAVSNNGPVCIGNTLELNSNSDLPDGSFAWTGPDNFSSDKQNTAFAYTREKEGVYTVRVTVNKCVSEPRSTEVTSKDIGEQGVATSNSPLTEGEALKLFGTNSKENVQYYWEGPNGFTSHEQNPVIPVSTFMYSGEYKLVCIYQGCSTETFTHVFVKDILGIRMKLYPNPNTGKFTITGLTQTDEVHYISVYNNLGMLVYRNETIPTRANLDMEIDAGNLASGVYVLQIQSRGEKATARFTVVRK